MPANRVTCFPMLVRADDPAVASSHVMDEFLGELRVAYTPGPPYGHHLLTWQELERSGVPHEAVRRTAGETLYRELARVAIHGQPPALMISFDGFESSVLLAHAFWDDLAASVPGHLVVAAPARDVVMFTGTQSRSGMRRLFRAADRIFLAGNANLLSRELLVRQSGRWAVFTPDRPVTGPSEPGAVAGPSGQPPPAAGPSEQPPPVPGPPGPPRPVSGPPPPRPAPAAPPRSPAPPAAYPTGPAVRRSPVAPTRAPGAGGQPVPRQRRPLSGRAVR